MGFIKKYSFVLLVLVLSIFTILPLFASGFFPVHDDTQVARVYEMKTALQDGMFPVRWVPDLGYNYGYPIFNFYGPLAYYVGGFLNLFGFDSLVATKLMIGLGTLLAGVFMYLFAKEFWGKFGGIVSAILYMYAPYHALNIYVRGAIGELWAYAFVPLAFYGIYKLFIATEDSAKAESKAKSKKQKLKMINQTYELWFWTAIAALGYALIITSHNLSAMMVTPFLFVFALILYLGSRWQQTRFRSYFILLSLMLGIFLSAFYWLPVFFEMKFTNVISVVGGGSNYPDHFVCLSQLWSSPWGFGGSVPGCLDGLSFRLGKFHIIFALFSIISLFFLRKQKTVRYAILLGILGAAASIFLLLEESKMIWDAIPQMAFFQFPWRFLVLSAFFLSFLGGSVLAIFNKNKVIPLLLCALMVFVIVAQNAKLFTPDKIIAKTAADYTAKQELTWTTSKISDEYMPPGFYKPQSQNQVPKSKIIEDNTFKLLSYSEKTKAIHATIETKDKREVLVNLAYFPGWHVYIDKKQEWFKHYGRGLLVTVPKGKHTVDIVFLQTPVEKFGNALTVTGVFVLLAGIISSRKEQKSA